MKINMDTTELSAISAAAYIAVHVSFIATTVIALTLHLRGKHENCLRNLAVSAFLSGAVLAASGMKTYFTTTPAVQTVEAIAYLTMLFTPLVLAGSKLVEVNNKAAEKDRDTPDSWPSYYDNDVVKEEDLDSTQSYSMGAERINYNSSLVSPTAAVQRGYPDPAPNITHTKSTSIRGTAATPTDIPPSWLRPRRDVEKDKDTSKQAKKTGRPTADEIITSVEHARRLERLVVKRLAQGVRYNKKLHKIYINHLRHQDLIYIWQLGKTIKPNMTERSKARLKSLKLVTVDRKTKTKKNRIEVVEEVRLTERGYAVRQAIAMAAQQIMGKAAANAGPHT